VFFDLKQIGEVHCAKVHHHEMSSVVYNTDQTHFAVLIVSYSNNGHCKLIISVWESYL